MNTQNLRTLFQTITESKILNLSYGSGDHYTVIPMIAKKEDTFCLWEISAMSEQEYEYRNRTYKEAKTNRAELKQNLEEADQVWIEKIVSGGCCFEAASVTGTCLGEQYNIEEQMQFLYMLEQGVKLGELEQVELDRLFINCYELTGKDGQELSEEAFWNLGNGDVTVTLSKQHRSVLVQKRLRLKTGEYEKPKAVRLTGEAESCVYIHGICFHDLWKEAETRFEDKRYTEHFSEEQIAQMKQEFMELLPQICPKGCVLPMIEYECDRDYQMQFYTTEYLKRVPEHHSSALFFVVRPDTQTGPMGYRNRLCQLEAVEEGFAGEISVELFLCHKTIPGEEKKAKHINHFKNTSSSPVNSPIT